MYRYLYLCLLYNSYAIKFLLYEKYGKLQPSVIFCVVISGDDNC